MLKLRVNEYDFEELCLPLHADLVDLARRLCQRFPDAIDAANDIVQESLLKAMLAWERFVPPDGADPARVARGWLMRIVQNTYIKAYHRRGVRVSAAFDHREEIAAHAHGAVPLENVISRDPGADAGMDAVDGMTCRHARTYVRECEPDEGFADEVAAALDKLEPDHREVVERHYVRGQDYETIARELGVPKGTICSRLARARDAIAPALEQYARESYGLPARVGADQLEAPQAPQTKADGVNGVVRRRNGRELRVAQAAPHAASAR